MYSIQQRITRNILLCVVGGSLLSTFVLSSLIERYLSHEFDEFLLQKTRTLITLTTQRSGEIELDFAGEFMPEYERLEDAEYFQLWFADGRLIERSDSLTLGGIERDLERNQAQGEQVVYSDIALPDGRRGRLVTVMFVPQLFDEDDFDPSTPEDDLIPDPHGGVQDTDEIDPTSGKPISDTQAIFSVAKEFESTQKEIWMSTVVVALVFALVMLLVYFLCRRAVHFGLTPLHDISEAISDVDVKNLNASERVRASTTELQPIATRFNTLIGRLQEEFDNQKRFTGNVAHELRTPIAELKMLSEVAERWPDDKDATKRFYQDTKEIAEGMSKIVVDLLELTRADSGNFRVVKEQLDLNDLLTELTSKLKAKQPKVNLNMDMPSVSVMVNVDRQKLSQVILNLLNNAVTYRADLSAIDVSVATGEKDVTLSISNQTNTLEHNDLEVMFKRFWRKDVSRTGSGNSGLGLSIVKEFCDQMEIDIEVDLTDKQFTVTLVGIELAN